MSADTPLDVTRCNGPDTHMCAKLCCMHMPMCTDCNMLHVHQANTNHLEATTTVTRLANRYLGTRAGLLFWYNAVVKGRVSMCRTVMLLGICD